MIRLNSHVHRHCRMQSVQLKSSGCVGVLRPIEAEGSFCSWCLLWAGIAGPSHSSPTNQFYIPAEKTKGCPGHHNVCHVQGG